MATFDFDGSTSISITFDPLIDVLNINGLSAADVDVKKMGSSVVIKDPSTGNKITLTGTKFNELTTSNVMFDDGSVLIVGDDSATGKADKHGNDIDLSTSTADNQVYGLGGSDTISMGDGSDIVYGGKGKDLLDGAGGDDTLLGGKGKDLLGGGDGNDHLEGGKQRDTLNGGTGDDTLLGGQGRDILNGGDGNDHLEGGKQRDTLNGGTGDDTLLGGKGKDLLGGGDGNDHLEGGKGRDTLNGGDGNDHLEGGKGRDILDGGTGDDTLSGSRGRDELDGGDGNDILDGGRGRDMLEGGTGNDTITGGLGADSIIFNSTLDGVDQITDFDHTEGDQLLLNGGNSTNEFQWGYQSTGATKANTMGTITSDFLLEASNKGDLLNAVSIAASSLFGSTIGSGVSSVGYFFGLTAANSSLFYFIANQHTETALVTTTFSTVTVAMLEGITGLGTGINQIAQSDIILF